MKRSIIRKIVGALFLVGALVVIKVPAKDAVADATTSDFDIVGTTLLKYTGTASTVSVPDSIKVIGDEAFSDNSYITSVKLPNTVEKISYAAFSGCNNLKEINIPDSVTEIGTAAFCNCTSLSGFSFGSGVKELGTGVFAGCESLTSISANSRFVFDSGALYDKDKEVLYELLESAVVKKSKDSNDYVLLTEYNMPNTVKSIKPYAFYGCKNIKNVNLSTNLDEIPAYSFSYCNAISSIKIPAAVKLIDVKAFQYCINLEDVEMSVNVNYIHKTAFDGCPKLNIIAPVDSYAYNWFLKYDKSDVNIIDTEDNGSTDNILPEGSSSNGGTNLPDGFIGETVIVGRNAVFFIDNSDISVNGGSEEIIDYSSNYAQEVEAMESALNYETNGKGLSIPKFAVIDDVIAGKAFYNDADTKGFEFPSTITSIGDFAFARSGLTAARLNEGLKSIGYGAFYHCDDLEDVYIPDSVENIEPSAFEYTKYMDNFIKYSDDDFLVVGDGILLAYKGLNTYVKIPDNVKKIGPQVFKNHNEITNVEIPDSVTTICEEAFYNCKNLTSVLGGMNVLAIEDRAFYACPINTVRIVESVETVGAGAFDLSESKLGAEYRCVVFHGDSIPKFSYNKTTSRLTNTDYRIDSFNGINVCVVSDENIDLKNTLLDSDAFGFSGLICAIKEENNSYFNGTLKIIGCTLTKEEAQSVIIPSTVYIYDKGYNFIEEDLQKVLDKAKKGEYEKQKNISSLVSFDGDNSKYSLSIIKKDDSEILREAYKRIYGDTVPANLNIMDISLLDSESGVNITKLGLNNLKISIKLPDNVPSSNLHIICTDEYGQLEDLPFVLYSKDNQYQVSFEINHTGTYGIYSYNSSQSAQVKLDESPDTGDLTDPRYFLALGLFAIGMALILMKKRTFKI